MFQFADATKTEPSVDSKSATRQVVNAFAKDWSPPGDATCALTDSTIWRKITYSDVSVNFWYCGCWFECYKFV